MALHDGEDAARAALSAALGAVARGDRAALRTVYDRTSAKLFGICLRICDDRAAAEEILQTVYLKVWESAARFDPARASPITWLAAIARNAAIDWRRANRRHAAEPIESAFDLSDDAPSPEALALAGSTRARILVCFDELAPRQRAVVQAAFFEGLSYPELASAAQVPLGTMKSWIRRALIQLRGCIGDG